MIDAARSHARRIGLRAEQELRTRQDEPQRVLDPRLEVALILPRLIEAEQRLDVAIGDRPSISAAGQRPQNFLGARNFVLRIGWSADENPPAAGSVTRSLRVKRPGDLHV